MRPLKLHIDNRPEEQPENTYPFGKNGIQSDLLGSVFNEPGFTKMAAVVPYIPMGIILTGDKPILFSTNNTNSAIGYFNPDTELYEPIIDDATWALTGKFLGFSTNRYITGTSQRNYKGEVVIAFTDKTIPPMYLNCDAPNLKVIDDLRLFPYYSPPKISLAQEIGGILFPGTYYIAVYYTRNDGTSTAYSEISQGITVAPQDGAAATDKAILVTITNADQNYDYINVSVLSKVAGITKAILLVDPIPVTSGTVDILVTGDNLSSDISVEQVLTPPKVYNKVHAIGQLNDQLFLGGLSQEPDLDDMQNYANLVQLTWKSDLIDATAPPAAHVNGTVRSFMHKEVYAFFIRYHKTRGGFTKAFVLNGTSPQASDLVASTQATGFPGTQPKVFQVEDTIPFFNTGLNEGTCGVWVNDTEVYPDTIDFDSTALGGQNLRNQPVRHFRMPSLRWCKQNLYLAVPEYGRTKLDLLSIIPSNVTIPVKYTALIDGYEILYAKRTASNMTIFGQAMALEGAVKVTEMTVPTGNANIYTSGGNWTTSFDTASKTGYDHNQELRQLRGDTFRVHPFDILLNKPSLEATFLGYEFKLKTPITMLEDGGDGKADHNMPVTLLVDYTTSTVNPIVSLTGNILRAIKSSFYMAIGLAINKFNNQNHENAFGGTLYTTAPSVTFGNSADSLAPGVGGAPNGNPGFEEAWLVNLMVLKQDLYLNFYGQVLVSAGNYRALTDFSPYQGGDTFCSDYTYHTYGRHDAQDGDGEGIKGIKVIRRIVCESASNIALRYVIPGNIYSEWYPRQSVVPDNPDQCYPTLFQRSQDPNQFGYTKDLNALNDFISSTVFNPFIEILNEFPYRIHRGGFQSKQSALTSWRTFLPLDFYECQKNMGRILNIVGMDDRLLIHHEKALFLTQDKAKINGGLISVTLGTGDIFQFAPQQALDTPLGYAGTNHDLACVRTPLGYIFVDSGTGEIFLFKGGLENLNADINTFLRDTLQLTNNNPFTGNGITIGWDQKYKRILLTIKNILPAAGATIKQFQDTNAFFDGLTAGDIVDYFGRLIKYQGLNNPITSGYDCPEDPAVPDEYEWRPYTKLCAQQDILTVEGASSQTGPEALLWDETTQKVYVVDLTDTTCNFYKLDPITLAKTYLGIIAYTGYIALSDPARRRLYIAGLDTGGLAIYDIATETVITIPYGTNSINSRTGLWKYQNTLLALDGNSNTISIIDEDTLNVVAVKNISSDIPSGSVYFNGSVNLIAVEGTIWVVPALCASGVIAVYDGTLSNLITTITLSGIAPVTGFGGNKFIQAGYYDSARGKVYIADSGSATLFSVNISTFATINTLAFTNLQGKQTVFWSFSYNPDTNDLFINYQGVNSFSDGSPDNRVYKLDESTDTIIRLWLSLQLPLDLEAQGFLPYIWGIVGTTVNKYLSNG